VGTAYFETMGIGLIAGREFSDQDLHDRPSVVIVNQTLAAEYWPGESAVGKVLGQPGSSEVFDVVGVVRDSKYHELTEDPRRFCYFPVEQSYRAALTFVTRAETDPEPVAAAVRERVAGVDPDVALLGVGSMESYLDRALLLPRLGAGLLTAFAALGLLLAAVGIYGLISYAVTRRRREVGIRLALGASSRQVIRLVLRDSLKLTLIGAALGLVAAIGAGRLAQGLLFATSPSDPLTLAGTALVLIATAALAAFIPALRAARVQPSEALRSE
jgi:predicted permease